MKFFVSFFLLCFFTFELEGRGRRIPNTKNRSGIRTFQVKKPRLQKSAIDEHGFRSVRETDQIESYDIRIDGEVVEVNGIYITIDGVRITDAIKHKMEDVVRKSVAIEKVIKNIASTTFFLKHPEEFKSEVQETVKKSHYLQAMKQAGVKEEIINIVAREYAEIVHKTYLEGMERNY